MYRTHTCGELRKEDISKNIILSGWVWSRRDHGDIVFIDMRDKFGVTQIVFDPSHSKESHAKAHNLRNEYCLKISGIVKERPAGTINSKLATGDIEVYVEKIEILSESEPLPFEIKDQSELLSEEVRLKYRYLDLRRPSMQYRLNLRHRVYKYIFDFFSKEGFTYIETPILTKSTPEGARDYLVPSRLQKGSFYALPQSPQIFKQLLMVSGLEKYFQIAKCFRDEDLRADRQPEFTQLDLEMSFVEQNDILNICEKFYKGLFKEALGRDIEIPFQRMTHSDAMDKYGSDKPDLRFGMELANLTDGIKEHGTNFKIFNDVISSGGRIMGLAAEGYGSISRKDIDTLTAFAGEYGAKGLAYFKIEDNVVTSPIVKFFPEETINFIKSKTGAKPGDMIFIVAADKATARSAMGALRLKIGKEKGLSDAAKLKFLWVVDFPLFTYDKEDKRWVSEHHPFTSFIEEDAKYLETGELDKVRSKSYDLVLNGSEIGSGSIRIHRKDIQKKVFNILGIDDESAAKKFGFLLEAFSYGAPPHGGVAFGIDRLITLFTGDSSIREVIPFPKTQRGVCPLSDAPSSIDELQLRDLGLKLNPKILD
ncbi:aspartyl-tRNA synthase [Candidatus Omnitrophus magneticus]|uniref:Aspartate--tRNA(Asp/Asn) ligase n=1 Tax=Candidatus Omnitrophus magneticus TaxID=1609969 RepID=A0A0F0CTI0_9BACT|nr:aspartyl-tRNA synthase [Candidatus Omnitrophus magneticus]